MNKVKNTTNNKAGTQLYTSIYSQTDETHFKLKQQTSLIQEYRQILFSIDKKNSASISSEKDHNQIIGNEIIRYLGGENNLNNQAHKSVGSSMGHQEQGGANEDLQITQKFLQGNRHQGDELIQHPEKKQPSLFELDRNPTTSENLGVQLEGFELGSFTAIRRVNSICDNNSDEEKDDFSPVYDKKIQISNNLFPDSDNLSLNSPSNKNTTSLPSHFQGLFEGSSTPSISLRLRAKQGSLLVAPLDMSSTVQRSSVSLAERRNRSLAQSLSLDTSGKQLGKSNAQQGNHVVSNSSLRLDGQSSSQQVNSYDYLQFLSARPFFWEYFALQLYLSVFKMLAVKQEHQRAIAETASTTTFPTQLGISNDPGQYYPFQSSSQQQQSSLNLPSTFIFQNIANAISVVRLFTLSKTFASTVKIHTEVSWPFLFFDSTQIINGDTRFKAEPAIQNQQNKQILQSCLFTSPHIIHIVGSFHSYVPQKYKFFASTNLPENIFPGDFTRAINGLFSLGGQLPALWTVAMAGSSILLDQIKHSPQLIPSQGKKKHKKQTSLFIQAPSHFLRMETEKQAKQQSSWGDREGFSHSSSDEHSGIQSKESQEITSFVQKSQEIEEKKESSPLNIQIQNIINQKQQFGLEDSIEMPRLTLNQGDLPQKVGTLAALPALSAEEETKLIRLVDVLCRNPAKIFGLTKKGTIQARKHADFIMFDPFSLSKFSAQVDESQGFPPELHILNSQTVLGQVKATYLKGAKVFDSGVFDLTKVSSSQFPS